MRGIIGKGFSGGLLRRLCGLAPLLAAAPAIAQTDGIVFVVPLNESMPLAHFENGRLVSGLYKDLGEAVAGRMGLRADYDPVPGARISEGLAAGHADALCYVQREWTQGSFEWGPPLVEDSELIIARADAPPVRQLSDLADQPVGTIIKYHYLELQKELGTHFLRDDSQDMAMNIRRVAAGRLKYAVVEKLPYDYLTRDSPNPMLRIDLAYAPITRMCAFSQKSKISFSAFDAAVRELIADGTMGRMLDSYR